MRLSACNRLLCSVGILLMVELPSHLIAQNGEEITLSLNNASLQKLINAVEVQTSYRFVYTNEQLQESKPITVSIKDLPLKAALDKCFQDQPLVFSLEEKYIILRNKPTNPKNELIDITGIISNEKGDPVIGATVSIIGSQKATSTGLNGDFVLKQIPNNATLVFSGTDVESRQIMLHGQLAISVTLKTKTKKIDEVQVIAYGTTTRRINTGDVSTIGAETIAEQPVSNPLAALEGRAPGLVITQNSGSPGSGFFVQIRGQNSIANGNDPLYVIDGVPYASTSLASTYTSSIIAGGNPLSSINPADIESVNILKDADATSIYGSRGANGVILITTKHGKQGKTKVDFNSYFGAGKIDRSIKLLNTQQYLTMRNEAFKNDGTSPSISNGDYDLLVWDTTRYTDWQTLLIGNTANIADAQLTISGGDANTQFSLGGGFHRETTVFPGDFADQKGSGHFSLNHISNDNKFRVDLSVTYGIENNTLPSLDFVSQAMSLPPDAPALYDSLGKLNWPPGFNNPYSNMLTSYKATTNNLISHAVLNYTVIPSLQLRIAMGYNNIQMNEKQINPLTSLNPAYDPVSGNTFFSNSSLETWILEPQIEYLKQLGPGKLDLLLGMTAEQDVKTGMTEYGTGFSSDALLENIAAASSTFIFSNTYSQYRYQAFFGRLNYNVSEKYILNLTGRRDGSSRFGPDKQFANFGAVGAAWIFSKENFIKELLPFLSFGKIRSSYGITGNDQIGDYQYLSTYSTTRYPYQNESGLTPTRLYNPNYAWETNRKFEVGLELGFINDRLLLSASYYSNHSSNQLVGYPLPYITGFNSIQQNLSAVVQNTGLEFGLNYTVIKSGKFTWSLSANLTFPENKLISFPGIAQTGYDDIYQVGKPLSIYKAYQYLDVDPPTGIYAFVNTQGKSTITPVFPDDLKPIKNVAAVYYGGIQNNFQYKGWRLDIFFQFTKQNGWNYIRNYYTVPGMQGNQPEDVMKRWQNPGNISTFQKFSQAYDSAYNGYFNSALDGDNAVSDASFIRLKNIAISYTFPGLALSKLRVQNLRVYLQGQNLLTITDYFGMDPENQSSTALPPLKIITAGIQVTF